ncbi:heme oxygenase 1 [Stomoxys calcitrans]|uniref:heme oxygenase 1 n=1 Tax=Stomoxys calcitrans TaxID=35570 RepID=UPI0027E2A670|nr:heme oxygenase 1 [Stomoxys calcitrans]
MTSQTASDDNVTEQDMTFTKELRAATKEVHKISDVLVNAKFAFALSDDAVWYDGLLSFYEIYKFLERNLPQELLPKELHRTQSFEKDFDFFYGENWRDTYEIRPAVRKYLDHLEEVNKKDKLLLFAYAYQMYMALMSGGQLLQKKRMIARKLWPGSNGVTEEEEKQPLSEEPSNPDDLTTRPMPVQVSICPEGCSATYFTEKITVLKGKLRKVLNDNYGKFDEQMKAAFIEESKNVFLFNSDVVRSIKGVNRANIRKLAIVVVFFVSIYFAIKLARR